VTALALDVKITKPGVYDIPAEIYHADPVEGGSLSSTGARRLMPPSCPALYRHEQLHGRPPKREFDLGHAAHKLVLGSGPELVVVDADNYRTKAAQNERDEAYAVGAVPLLAHEYEQVQEMAAALRAHPIASKLFDPKRGVPEQSLFWRDPVTKVVCRARLDWLPDRVDGIRMIIGDYKTCASAETKAATKAIHTHGYHQQADWYLDGIYALDLADKAAFVFVFQEKTAPYLVNVVEADQDFMKWGRVLNDKARDVYRHCMETGVWPGYSDEVELAQLPPYADKQYEIDRQLGLFDTLEGKIS
jgi:hypothetical protein